MVIGTGISGIGAAALLYEKGAKITIYDANKKVDIKKVQEKLVSLIMIPYHLMIC